MSAPADPKPAPPPVYLCPECVQQGWVCPVPAFRTEAALARHLFSVHGKVGP